MSERITEAEQVVLEILWDEAPATAARITDRAFPKRQWNAQTVKTILARLVQKGAVEAEADGRRFLYRPLMDRAALVETEAQHLLDRLFDGKAAPLVAHLVKRADLSAKDADDIERLLGALKR
ncbi:CopY family transcriptional repressor [Sphingobium yanoikuyae]|uniref:CopY family transcriptional repressor n=1 Tax=Sphingobium yanoikuyae TaxID=13690 RepID=A0A177JWV9_SPHYA|nr:BlaI/MecI/CopY family transcriptional regulator [Sphingobium yanoikuyae]OAH45404.1 CopY family transcriptional repressor [Sphingobium yanoikuyae]